MPCFALLSLARPSAQMRNLTLSILQFCCLSVLLLLAIPMTAQTGLATLSGTVTDPSGAVIPKANVTVTNEATTVAATTQTTGAGVYVVSALPPGLYRVIVEHLGFKQIEVNHLELHTQDVISRNFVLPVGAASETIQVEGNQNAINDSPAVSMTVSQEFVESTPLNGRSFQDLIQLAPGTISSAAGNGTYSVNGQRDDANNFTVDGVSANVGTTEAVSSLGGSQSAAGVYPNYSALGTTQTLLSVDAMQEFRMQTSGYTAEYGRQPGGQVEITSRSGTDQLHGTAYDYLRNTVFDANNWFANNRGTPREAEHQNDFGGTLGGPVTIPRLYSGKGRTFFFFSYEGLRLLLPQFIYDVDYPTPAFRQSASPAVQPFLNAVPIPNGALDPDGIDAQYSGGVSVPGKIDSTSLRIDHSFNNKYRVFARVADTPSSSEGIGYPGGSITSVNQFTATVGATAELTSHLVDELRFNHTRSAGTTGSGSFYFGGATPFPLDLLVPAQYASLPGGYLSVGNISIPGTSLNVDYYSDHYPTVQEQNQLVDSISWARGDHTFKFGVDYRLLHPSVAYGQYRDFFSLSTLSDIQNGVSDYFQAGSLENPRPLYTNLSLYAQDHWKVSHRLVIDYGLRWEFNPPPGPTDGLYPYALTSSNITTAAPAPYGTPMYHTTYTNFAPRLGFSLRINASQSHPVVLRAGSGIFYDTGQNLGLIEFSSEPFAVYNEINNFGPVTMPFTSVDFTPPPLNSTNLATDSSDVFSDPNLVLPRTYQWNLALDIGLIAKNTMTLSYVGNSGRKLLFYGTYYSLQNPNLPDAQTYGEIQFASNASSSSYNALQVQDIGYITSHLQFVGSYTWSHSIDNASSEDENNGNVGVSVPVRGNSDNDIPQSANAAVNYDIQGIGTNRIARVITNGWLVTGRVTAQSGYPVFIRQGTYNAPSGVSGIILPNLVKGVPLYLHNVPGVPGGFRINPAAFSPVSLNPDGSPVVQGNVPRNFVRGPAFWNMNAAVQKNTKIADQLQLVFRAEAFNPLNHPSFAGIQGSLQSSIFGEATASQTIGVANSLYATGGPRSLQFMLKLQF